ncbi:MAG TPA: radical SAM protein [Candidatus Binatia bacterium]|nr:radical SAM protein [Candidatus Binatia bacterium]
MNVLLLYPKFPEETFWNTARSVKLLWGRPAIMPPLGLLTIASYLPADFSLRLVDRNVADETEADWDWADVVFLSAMLAQREDYRACVDAARRRGKPVAVGGPLTHALPETAAADGDWVCYGEAETVIDEVAADIRADRRGKHYQGGASTDMETVRVPRYELLPDINAYATMDVQFSRGCPFRCEFCDIIEIYGRVPRTKTARQIAAELASIQRLGFRGYIFMVDDNFIGNRRKARAMLEDLAVWNRAAGYPFRYYTEASINLADDDELMRAMAAAGFFHVFIGIETPDPKLLKTTQKMQNVPGNPLEKLRRIRARGIHVTAGFIVGFDGEERGVFDAQRKFIEASGIGVAMVGLLQAIPHTQLARRLRAEGRLLDPVAADGISTREGINFIPKGAMTKREYLERYAALVRDLYTPEAFFRRSLPALLELRGKIPAAALRRNLGDIVALIAREIYYFGVADAAMRRHFWKAFVAILWNNPAALEAFVFDASIFDHLRRHAAYIERELARYLDDPPEGDVLDRALAPAAAPPYAPAAAGAGLAVS